ncbi:RNA helicase [Malassezia nana]|uniref:RNA helicase n=1 Tax=Malassezia nana TaxID=180528 RepID=A0AAF0EQP6_9BASI|nr:RNA helicase [Malassezia nana]
MAFWKPGTQRPEIPQFLLEAGWAADQRQIVCTQPRRVAASSLAARVAEETHTCLGDVIGYAVRFEDCTHPTRTRVRFTTPGLLFRECLSDPLLSRYSVVLVDEAHERGAYTDLLIALLQKIRRKRPDLRILLSSATMDAEAFARYLDPTYGTPEADAMILSIEGRTFPVQVAYTPAPVRDYVAAAVDAVWALHTTEPAGDVLVFLPGRDDIETTLQALADRQNEAPRGGLGLQLLPLYASLSLDEQRAALAPAPRGMRKVVAATNVAETSVTIDGVCFVVDTGLAKVRMLDPATGLDTLATRPASQAAAFQRAGRAGRTAPGKCLRLYPAAQFAQMPATDTPELVRCDLAMYLLQLKALGIDNLARFAFVPPAPPAAHMARALTLLASMQALDEYGRLLPLGEQLAEAPLDPRMARAVLYAAQQGCADELVTIAAMLSVATPFLQTDVRAADPRAEIARRKFVAEEGDALTLLNVYEAFMDPRQGRSSAAWAAKHALSYATLKRAQAIRAQLAQYVTLHWRLPLRASHDATKLRYCLAAGFFQHAARWEPDGTFRTLQGTTLHAHPSSVYFTRAPPSRWVVYTELVHTTQPMIRDVTAVDEAWLLTLAPHYYETRKKT